MLCAFGPDIWGKASGTGQPSAPHTVSSQCGLQLFQVLDGEFKRNLLQKKGKKKYGKRPTDVFTLGPVLCLEMFSQWQT